MKIIRTTIEGMGGILFLDVVFDASMNIICGPNGIGKTTVLDAIAQCFTGSPSSLKRNVNFDVGKVETIADIDGEQKWFKYLSTVFMPGQQQSVDWTSDTYANYVIMFKTTRTLQYVPIDSISKDPIKGIDPVWDELRNGVSIADVKNWFVHRYLYSKHDDALTKAQISNFEVAKSCFGVLEPGFSFSRVDAKTNEILVNTPGGEIYYEYLSSGFKSCLAIMLAIIKEVEFRFGLEISVEAFSGVILLDELELHLHPVWQSKIALILTQIFPSIQFIVTTHSPHIIQSAETNQIRALQWENGVLNQRELPSTEYGFKNWTLDEVLTDVMGMSDTRTDTFLQLINDFDAAVEAENFDAASAVFAVLDRSLHPNNHVRKLLKLQLAGIREAN